MFNGQVRKLSIVAIVTTIVLSLPIWVIVSYVFTGAAGVWQHLWQTVLGDYVTNSILLMLGVATGTLIIGVSTAWLTTAVEFPARRVLSLLLLLPLAMPAYIIAYTYTGLLDFAGPVQTWIRELTGLRYGQYWFPNVQSVGGAIVMLTLVLYPYVYLMSRAAFLAQPSNLLDVSRTLGLPVWKGLFTVVLPMARPAIIAGLSLALMETLADYGTVQYFGVSTFTTGIFRTFYGFGDAPAAAQLSVVLLTFVFVLVVMEKYSRRKIGYYANQDLVRKNGRMRPKRFAAWSIFIWCALPVLLGFLLPIAILAQWSFESTEWQSGGFVEIAINTLMLAFIAAALSVFLSLLLAYAVRLQPSKPVRLSVQVASLGYALPGTIIAIGVVITFAWLDHNVTPMFERLFLVDLGLFFSGTIFAIVFAYTTRFLAVSFGSIHSGLQAIKPSIDGTAQLLGRNSAQVIKDVHVPMLKPAVLTAFLIVFVDVLKELPATLMLRPFNFNTLAVRAFEMASDERLIDAAPSSILIVAVGLIPVILLNRSITKS